MVDQSSGDAINVVDDDTDTYWTSGSGQNFNQWIAFDLGGRLNEQVIDSTRTAGYEAAFSTQPGFNRRDINHYRIRRLDIFGTDTATMLARKIFFGSNDGSWQQTWRYYKGRVADKLGL